MDHGDDPLSQYRSAPDHMPLNARKCLAVRSRNFCLISDILYHKGSNGLWRRAIRHFEKKAILQEAHQGIAGGHYARESTARKVWQSGLWWPTTKKDAHEFCRQCDLCQRLGQPMEQARMPHQPILPLDRLSYLSPPDRCVSRVGTAEVLD